MADKTKQLRTALFTTNKASMGGNQALDNTIKDLEPFTPAHLMTHTLVKDYALIGMTPEEFMSEYSTFMLNFKKLEESFLEVCPDYDTQLAPSQKSISLEFAAKIIYEIGPESRLKTRQDKKWRMRVVVNNPEGKNKIKYIMIIATFANASQPQVENNCLVLTMKQAALLSLRKINELGVLYPEDTLLTPLAKAIFPETNMEGIKDLYKLANLSDAVAMVNASCQIGGHHLRHSSMACAAAAALTATQNMKSEEIRISIVSKIVKQYYKANKPDDKDYYTQMCAFTSGPVPAHWTFELLKAERVDAKKIAVARELAMQKADLKSTVKVPSWVSTASLSATPSTTQEPSTTAAKYHEMLKSSIDLGQVSEVNVFLMALHNRGLPFPANPTMLSNIPPPVFLTSAGVEIPNSKLLQALINLVKGHLNITAGTIAMAGPIYRSKMYEYIVTSITYMAQLFHEMDTEDIKKWASIEATELDNVIDSVE